LRINILLFYFSGFFHQFFMMLLKVSEFLFSVGEAGNYNEQYRNNQYGKRRGCYHSPENSKTYCIPGSRPCPCSKCKRQNTQDKCHGSHKDGTKSQPHSFQSGFYKFFSMINAYFSKFHNKNCILR